MLSHLLRWLTLIGWSHCHVVRSPYRRFSRPLDRKWRINYLTPWPGPQCILSIHKFVVPGPIDIQSSPVWILLSVMVTLVEDWTWIPSVLGLRAGAIIFTFCTFTLLQLLITRCISWLLIEVKPSITMSLAQLNVIDCNSHNNNLSLVEHYV